MDRETLTVTVSYARRPLWQWVYSVPVGFVRRFQAIRHESIVFRLGAAAYLGTRKLKINGREVALFNLGGHADQDPERRRTDRKEPTK